MPPEISKDILNRLAEFDSCSIADAIETFEVRLRNEGFNDPTIRCFFPQFAPMIGFAGVHINPGDLIHGDANGIVNVPLDLVARIPEVAEKLKAREQEVTLFCASDEFSLSGLGQIVENGRLHR
jgi:hypothetical protein